MAGNFVESNGDVVVRPPGGQFNAFLKAPSAVVPTGTVITLPQSETIHNQPEMSISKFHAEPEFAIIIGKTAANVSVEDAPACIFGYTQFMDVSARGLPGGFFLGKSWHQFGPMGPVLVLPCSESLHLSTHQFHIGDVCS